MSRRRLGDVAMHSAHNEATHRLRQKAQALGRVEAARCTFSTCGFGVTPAVVEDSRDVS